MIWGCTPIFGNLNVSCTMTKQLHVTDLCAILPAAPGSTSHGETQAASQTTKCALIRWFVLASWLVWCTNQHVFQNVSWLLVNFDETSAMNESYMLHDQTDMTHKKPGALHQDLELNIGRRCKLKWTHWTAPKDQNCGLALVGPFFGATDGRKTPIFGINLGNLELTWPAEIPIPTLHFQPLL